MEKIKPALTAEAWKRCIDYGTGFGGGPRSIDGVFEEADDAVCHYIAALALHGQPFGFTWEDVDLLRGLATWVPPEWKSAMAEERLRGLADRIAALLPVRRDHNL